MNRRSLLRSIPAAVALAVLPSRLTRNVEAADGITVYGVPSMEDWIPNTHAVPYAYVGETGPELITVSSNASTVVAAESSWDANRWEHGPITIWRTDGSVVGDEWGEARG